MTFDDEMIMAYVDGECDPVTIKRIEKAMEADAFLAEQVSKARALRVKLAAFYAPVAEEAVPDRLSAMLTSAATANVDHSFTARKADQIHAQRQGHGFGIVQWGAMAATLASGAPSGGRTVPGQTQLTRMRGASSWARAWVRAITPALLTQ